MKFTTKRMVTDALLMAMYVVLALFVVIPLGNMKITLEALPILLAAWLYGPIDGLLVGGLGSFLAQVLGPYGLTATTLLWVLPHAVSGAAVGLMAMAFRYKPSFGRMVISSVVSALLVTALNTLAMYIDSKIYGYYSKTYVFGALAWRILAGIITAVVFALILPEVVKLLNREVGIGARDKQKEAGIGPENLPEAAASETVAEPFDAQN